MKTLRTGLYHGEDVEMMNFRRAAVFMVVFAFTALAQDYTLTGPLSHRTTTVESATAAERATLTVPAETEVKVQVLSGIHSQINHVNDPVVAEVLKPVFVEENLALPSGSLLDGHITLIRNAGHMHRAAELGMRFDHITLPDGQDKPVAAVLAALEHPEILDIHLDSEGRVTSNRAMSWKTLGLGFGALGTFGALKIYAYTPTQKVVALDAATGQFKWKFDSGINGTQPARGLTYWAGDETGGRHARIFAGVMNFLD